MYTLKNLIINSSYDYCAIIDSDMFPYNTLSIKELLKGYDIAAVPNSRCVDNVGAEYFWGNILFFDMKTIPNLDTLDLFCGFITLDNKKVPVDVGGLSYHYILNNNIRWKRLVSHTGVDPVFEGYTPYLNMGIIDPYIIDINLPIKIPIHYIHQYPSSSMRARST